ncbi:ATP-grasp domain-containing protein [Melghirimyces algeriensis]|uniref:ATP-grasp domain-containing protein n=1 Tax=Melghirimyces algeriensis TaxID=910412 RepID=A0A521DWV4_9BACL|nr:ATP-grasp domain-containing protein [Melghirimyces algeriensis]SMO76193.1 ATP-grasp domain-containing protein [Melghirimyces algeriensis]
MGAQDTQKRIALIGWSLPIMEAADRLNRPFVVVGMPNCQDYAKKYDLPFVSWDFEKMNKQTEMEDRLKHAEELYYRLKDYGAEHAIPLFEETVEWAGALNALFKENPRHFYHSLLFRHKARMKRRALIGGLKVGVFEEGKNKNDVKRFFKSINDACLKIDNKDYEPVHIKAFDRAGAAGHRLIRSEEDIEKKLTDHNFPCLMESHLDGTEVSCEVFIRNGKILFLNITEYVVFGYSMMAPPSPEIEKKRPQIREACQQLIDAFDIDCGVIHPEFFLAEDGRINFGEVAFRVPGGHIYELIQRTYGFNAFEGHLLCCDPNTTDEELHDFFPDETKPKGHAGSLLVYPRVKYIQGLNIPETLENHPGYDRHNMFTPVERKVPDREGYGNHHGTVFFYHEDSEHVRQPLQDFVEHDFYI